MTPELSTESAPTTHLNRRRFGFAALATVAVGTSAALWWALNGESTPGPQQEKIDMIKEQAKTKDSLNLLEIPEDVDVLDVMRAGVRVKMRDYALGLEMGPSHHLFTIHREARPAKRYQLESADQQKQFEEMLAQRAVTMHRMNAGPMFDRPDLPPEQTAGLRLRVNHRLVRLMGKETSVVLAKDFDQFLECRFYNEEICYRGENIRVRDAIPLYTKKDESFLLSFPLVAVPDPKDAGTNP